MIENPESDSSVARGISIHYEDDETAQTATTASPTGKRSSVHISAEMENAILDEKPKLRKTVAV